jgi:hypothetical protein
MTCDHYCNNEIGCQACQRRFWQWAQQHTRGRPRQRKGAQPALSFYEAAALFAAVDARAKR